MSDKAHSDRGESEEVDKADTSRARIDRARLARVFGEVLPDITGDERGGESGGVPADWMREQRPPHYS